MKTQIYGPSPTVLLNARKRALLNSIIREYSQQTKFNEFIIDDMILPKLNVQRNQRRFSSVMNAILLFMDSQMPLIPPILKAVLSGLSYELNVLFDRDPSLFILKSKVIANWMRVSFGLRERGQGNIPDSDWNSKLRCPKLLSSVIVELNRLGDTEVTFLAWRILLSMFEIYNAVTVPKLPNLSTITAPSTVSQSFLDSLELDRALDDLGLDQSTFSSSYQDHLDSRKWHTSSASGPNGQALWMAHIDAKAVWGDKQLMAALSDFCLVNGLDLPDKISDCVHLPNFFKLNDSTPEHSKLHLIFEKGDKCRVIAIVDYWTQEALCPLHDTIFGYLKLMSNDGTFNQDRIADLVKDWTLDNTGSLSSLDLTAATDRLPIRLQSMILDKLIDKPGIGSCWASLLTNRSYKMPDGQRISYAAGQPMGAKSSFAMLALTHHVIVRLAALRANIPNFKDYVILGDDIVIHNSDVTNHYLKIMKSLGLEISLNKSILSSSETSLIPTAEICKRVFAGGRELSPLPCKLIAAVIENGDMAYQLQEELGRRSLLCEVDTFFLFCAGIINDVHLDFLAKLNGLPGSITGMKFGSPISLFPHYNISNFKHTYGVDPASVEEIHTFGILVEQLKRADVILKNTTDIYTTITKAAAVSKTIGIGKPETGYLPVEQFSPDDMEEWDIVETFHPAVEAVRGEVDRINTILMQLVNAPSNTKALLKGSLIDSLRISSYETLPDADIAHVRVTRKLIDLTLRNISAAKKADHNLLTYTIKLTRLNILWYVRVSLTTPCTISRTFNKISTFSAQAKSKLEGFSEKFKNSRLF